MIDAKLIRQVLDKFLKAETVKHARMQVMTPDGVFHDIKSVKLLENKNFMDVCNEHTDKAILNAEPTIAARRKKLDAY